MKTILRKTNPDFKRAQLLPMFLVVPPPTAGGAAMRIAEFISQEHDQRRITANLAACALSAKPGFNPAAVRLLN